MWTWIVIPSNVRPSTNLQPRLLGSTRQNYSSTTIESLTGIAPENLVLRASRNPNPEIRGPKERRTLKSEESKRFRSCSEFFFGLRISGFNHAPRYARSTTDSPPFPRQSRYNWPICRQSGSLCDSRFGLVLGWQLTLIRLA